MIVQRRIFQAKVGQAGAVVAKLKEAENLFARADGWPTGRVYSDYHSGATDRVAWEIEAESLGGFEELIDAIGGDASFGPWFGELTALIEGASVEFWNIES